MSLDRVVLLGGTFDPIHAGHLAIAEQARDQMGAAEAWLIPAALPPHRLAPTAAPEDRLAMCEAAVAGRPGLRVLDLELRRPGPSYTIDTLAALEREHPATEFWFCLGADAAREVRSWHRYSDLLAQARVVVVNRSGVPDLGPDEARGLGLAEDRTVIIRVTSPPVSATEVRDRVRVGASLEGLLPPEVAAIILARDLYRPRGAAAEPVG